MDINAGTQIALSAEKGSAHPFYVAVVLRAPNQIDFTLMQAVLHQDGPGSAHRSTAEPVRINASVGIDVQYHHNGQWRVASTKSIDQGLDGDFVRVAYRFEDDLRGDDSFDLLLVFLLKAGTPNKDWHLGGAAVVGPPSLT